MSKGGGGAWKVAYADFVTAMMAFFLVMWICAQDQRIKQAIARYFVTPMGIVETGASKRPDRTGALFSSPSSGAVPYSESVALGRGRNSHTPPSDIASTSTKAISDWLRTNETAVPFWETQVEFARNWLKASQGLLDQKGAVDEAATRQLAKRLKDEITREVYTERNELSHDLLSQVLSEVNWTELAEDLVSEHDPKKARAAKTSQRPAGAKQPF